MDTRFDGIRGELALRLAALNAARTSGRAKLASDLDAVRKLAVAHGMMPAATVAHALENGLARGELMHGWLDLLKDAVSCERSDAATCDAFAAACSVRYN